MGKDIIVSRQVFRAYFGKCFDEILLGDRPHSLKQVTKKETHPVLHTYKKTTSEIDSQTGQHKSVHKVAGYYLDEEVNVKTGKLSQEQRTLLKQQFLQLAYDNLAKTPMTNKLYLDLTFDPKLGLPIESSYKSCIDNGNFNVETDYNKNIATYWENIKNTKKPAQKYTLKSQTMDMYYASGEMIKDSSMDKLYLLPNYKYRERVANELAKTWKHNKSTVFNGEGIFDLDDYLNALRDSVLENMDPEDKKIILEEFPDFGVTEDEKLAFMTRNSELRDHFKSLDPKKSGNKYVEKKFPSAKEHFVHHSTDFLEKYFAGTIAAPNFTDAKDSYEKELVNFANVLLEPQKNAEDINIRILRTEFDIQPNKIKSQKDIESFITKLHDEIMPSMILSQDSYRDYETYQFLKKNKKPEIVSINLNQLVCHPDIPSNSKIAILAKHNEKAAIYTEIYNEFVKPNINNGVLDMKKMQQVWLDLSSKMDEPLKADDRYGIKFIKNKKDGYKYLTEFNGEEKEVGQEFKYRETKLEWRNETAMEMLKESINIFASQEIKDQVNYSFRFDMKSADYRKYMHGQMRGREVAADALNRIKSLDSKKTGKGTVNPYYKYAEKDEKGFIVLSDDADTRQDYLKRCCAEINALKESYDNRSFWYHIAFWKTKFEKDAIKEIKNSLHRNGFTDAEINEKANSLQDKTNTDGAFDFKRNHHLAEDNIEEHEKTASILEDNKEIEAADLEVDKAKELVMQVLPQNNVVICDPIFGNVSEMYGPILNNERTTFVETSYELEKLAKEKLNTNGCVKIYTEKTVDIMENPGSSSKTELDDDDLSFLDYNKSSYDPEQDYVEDLLNNTQDDEDKEEIELDENEEIRKNLADLTSDKTEKKTEVIVENKETKLDVKMDNNKKS